MEMDRHVVHVDADILGSERREHLRAIDAQAGPSRSRMGYRCQAGSRSAGTNGVRISGNGERLVVYARRDLAASRQPRRQLPQLSEAERALDVGQPVVEAELDDLVEPRAARLRAPRLSASMPWLRKRPQPRRELRVVGRDHAALAGRDVLDRDES